MTNKLQQITILALATILLAGGAAMTQLAYSSGSDDDDDDDDDDDYKKTKKSKIQKELCKDPNNLIKNGCFEAPVVTNNKKWDIYDKTIAPSLEWDVMWLKDYDESVPVNPCKEGEQGFSSSGLLELHKGILGGPAEGNQHAELDSDCNGPTNNERSGEASSVAISQMFTTSTSNDYQVTFAYKARPDQPSSTNGMMVTWNDDPVPLQLDFNKKKWKYASFIVTGTSGSSKLTFEDTGTSDSLGTFLDDVSVIAIPKPVIKITLNKEISGGTITDPNAFGLKINEDSVNSGQEKIYISAGSFSINENGATNYVGTILANENCPFTSLGSSEELDLGDVVECTILNTFVPPPTVSVYHAVTQDNNGQLGPYATEFDLKVDDTSVTDSDKTVEVVANTPSQITAADANDYSFVLIAGDTKCPTTLDEDFVLEAGDHINCWIYHEDNFVEGGGAGPAPTVTLRVQIIDSELGITTPTFTVDGVAAPLDTAISLIADKTTEIIQTDDGIDQDPDPLVEILPSRITGDGNCPEVLAGTITLSAGQDIECTFEYGKTVEPGVIFHFGFVNFHIPSAVGFSCGDNMFPCIEFFGGSFIVVPDIDPNDPNQQQLSATTLILLTVQDITNPTQNVGCQVTGIGTEPISNRMGFIMKCPDLTNPADVDTFNANFALIETDKNAT